MCTGKGEGAKEKRVEVTDVAPAVRARPCTREYMCSLNKQLPAVCRALCWHVGYTGKQSKDTCPHGADIPVGRSDDKE